jgi:hypothetical protein
VLERGLSIINNLEKMFDYMYVISAV